MNSNFILWYKSSRAAKCYTVIAFLLCLGYYVLEYINGRSQMADFRVYYDAANAFMFDTQLYGKAFGVSSGFYKYSPFAAIPFIPLALLPYAVASFLYYLILSFAFIWWPLRLMHYLASPQNHFNAKNTGLILFLSVLFLLDHIERELHLGNINLFLLILAFASFVSLEQNKILRAGILYGVILLFKPHFLILLPYFIWKKQWKTTAVSALTIGVGFLLPALAKGWQGNVEIHKQWLRAMRDHNVSLEDSPNTIYGVINKFLLEDNAGSILVILVLAVVAVAYIYFLIRNKKTTGNSSIRFIEYFLLVALIPNLAHTDTEHFMWTWPLITFSLVAISIQGLRSTWWLALLMAFAFVPYCINSPDIVGPEIRLLFDEGGWLGLANLLFIAVAIYLYILHPPKTPLATVQQF